MFLSRWGSSGVVLVLPLELLCLYFVVLKKGNWIFKSLILVVNPWDCEHDSDLYPCVHITFVNYK